VKLRTLLSEYRWPLYLTGLLGMSIVAYAVLVWVATRPGTPRPIAGYYEASQRWDADEAVEAASRALGWSVTYDLPAGVPHTAGTPRPVDVRVLDREGRGVTGLAGSLFAIRPSDGRLNQSGPLVELPQEAGAYRGLVRVDLPGAWEFRVDLRRESLRFVHTARLAVEADALPSGETGR